MRRLPSEDAGLWRRAMRDVAPLPGRPPHPDRRHLAGTSGNAGETPAVRTKPGAALAKPSQVPPPTELPPLRRSFGFAELRAFANLVASITIQQLGTTGTASPAQVRQRWREVRGV